MQTSVNVPFKLCMQCDKKKNMLSVSNVCKHLCLKHQGTVCANDYSVRTSSLDKKKNVNCVSLKFENHKKLLDTISICLLLMFLMVNI